MSSSKISILLYLLSLFDISYFNKDSSGIKSLICTIGSFMVTRVPLFFSEVSLISPFNDSVNPLVTYRPKPLPSAFKGLLVLEKGLNILV